MKNWKIGLTLGIVCCILTIAICIQLKTVDDTNSTVSQTLTSNNLRDQVLKWKEKYDKAVADLETSEMQLENIRLQSTQNDENAVKKEEEIKLDNILLGLTDVKGDGVILTLKDNNSVSLSNIGPLDNIEYYLVHAGDLVEVVNDLRNAGAEAISINGQRIINITDIVSISGKYILVNGERIISPYEVRAIGNQDKLNEVLNFKDEGFIPYYKNKGYSIEMSLQSNISIPAYNQQIVLKYIKEEE